MSRPGGPFVTGAMLLTAVFLLPAPQGLAGARVVSGSGWSSVRPAPVSRPPQPVAVPSARALQQSITVSVVVTSPPRAAAESVYVDLRGPDGQTRHFPLEGGRAAIQSSQVVLRPGQSVTIQWLAAK
jgi:hypothetical protein